MMRYAVLVSVLLLLVPVALPGVVAGPAPVGPATAAQADSLGSVESSVDRRTTVFRVSMDRGGDAQWTVTTLYELDDTTERAAFERFAAAYRNGTAGAGPDPAVWRAAAATATDATGREMTVQDVSRESDFRNDSTGALVLRFEWTNFAEQTGNSSFRVRDVFQATDGTWLPQLGGDQVLIVETVADARITSTNYPLTNLNVRVTGPRDLAAEPVDLRYTLGVTPTPTSSPTPSPTPTPTPTPTVTPTPTPTPAPPDGPGDAVTFGVLVVVLAAAVVALVAYQGGLGSVAVAGVDDDSDDGDAATADAAPDAPPEPDASSAPDEATDDEPDAEPASEPASEPDPEPDPEPELLSDEERVEQLLERNGGRMRQADIVSETGWSDAKVSQLLSAMAEEGRVDKLRLGRENLISFPDADETDEE